MKHQRQAEHEDRVASLLETFFSQARTALCCGSADEADVSEAAISFLTAHGFDPQKLEDLPIGLFSDDHRVRQGLEAAGYSAQEIDASTLVADPRLAGRLVGPIRDPEGRIHSFWARDPSGQPPRLLYKGPWKDNVALIGLDTALKPAGSQRGAREEILVVERLFDCLVLQYRAFSQAAAIAGPAKDMTPQRWRRIAAWGVRLVVLAPDVDDIFNRDWLRCLENSFRGSPSLAVFVVLPEAWRRQPSAIEFMRARGMAAFRKALEHNRVHAYCYWAMALLHRHCVAGAWTEATRHAAWKEAIEFYATSDRDR